MLQASNGAKALLDVVYQVSRGDTRASSRGVGGMLDESVPYHLSQERLSPEETGHKSGIAPETSQEIHYDINGPCV